MLRLLCSARVPPHCCRTAGGGYVVGSCQWLLNTVAVIEATAGLTSICPEYHLAPEHPFLADLNDILSVYKAMIQPEVCSYRRFMESLQGQMQLGT